MSKSKGLCPFCKTEMIPDIVESNFLRRDRCRCTKCSRIIYICRTPFCNDYTKSGELYDDEFCAKHSEGLKGFVKDLPNKILDDIEKKVEIEKQKDKKTP